MSTLKIKKVPSTNVSTKEPGYVARVATNGTADYDTIAKYGARGSTISPSEMRAAAELFCEAAAEQLQAGYIIDLGPLGKLYPSVTGKWVASADELKKSDLTPKVNYRPSDVIAAAIKGVTLSWTSATDNTSDNPDDDATGDVAGDDTPTTGGGSEELPEEIES